MNQWWDTWQATVCVLHSTFYQLTGMYEPNIISTIAWHAMRQSYAHPLAKLITNFKHQLYNAFMRQCGRNGARIYCRDNGWTGLVSSQSWLCTRAFPVNMGRCRFASFILDYVDGNAICFQQFTIQFMSGATADRADCGHQHSKINHICSRCKVAICEECMLQAHYTQFCICEPVMD